MVGEALAYVQGESLKVSATSSCSRFINSPSTSRGESMISSPIGRALAALFFISYFITKLFFSLGHIVLMIYLWEKVGFMLWLVLSTPIVTEIWALLYTWHYSEPIFHIARYLYVFFPCLFVVSLIGLSVFGPKLDEYRGNYE